MILLVALKYNDNVEIFNKSKKKTNKTFQVIVNQNL